MLAPNMLKNAKTVAELLEIEAATAKESEAVFRELTPDSLALADMAIGVFDVAISEVDTLSDIAGCETRIEDIASRHGIEVGRVIEGMRLPPTTGEVAAFTEGRVLLNSAKQMMARKTLLQIVARAYRWAIGDLRRLRLTSAAGHMRVQVEAIALISLFEQRQDFALRWLNPTEDGRRFFSETQALVKAELRAHKLDFPYDHASGIADHARLGTISRASKFLGGTVEVYDQEFEPDNPLNFHLALAHYLRTQKTIFRVLEKLFHGLDGVARYQDAVAAYETLEDKVWWVLDRKYPKEIKEAFAVARASGAV